MLDGGYAIFPGFVDEAQARLLAKELRRRDQAGLFHAASIGRGETLNLNPNVRGDRICWLEEDEVPPPLQALQTQLNRQLYLGIKEFECHFAIYRPGGLYQKHLDAHHRSAARVVSAVLYLNESWCESDGGELLIYEPSDNTKVAKIVPPLMGTLALFLSQEVWHEVRPTSRERLSLTGWYRR